MYIENKAKVNYIDKLEELKLQIIAQNPSFLGVTIPDKIPEPPKGWSMEWEDLKSEILAQNPRIMGVAVPDNKFSLNNLGVAVPDQIPMAEPVANDFDVLKDEIFNEVYKAVYEEMEIMVNAKVDYVVSKIDEYLEARLKDVPQPEDPLGYIFKSEG